MAMQPRERRLDSEHREMRALAAASSLISFTTRGAPPTNYHVVMSCTGMRKIGDQLLRTDDHKFEIILDDSFPLYPPLVVWQTAVFHPNIRPPYVCTGNIWYAAMSLAEFCVTLCEMVQFKTFNVYSMLNDEAGEWVWQESLEDGGQIPIDLRPVYDQNFEISIRTAQAPQED